MSERLSRIARRIVAGLIEELPSDIPTLWYENEHGDRHVPEPGGDPYEAMPEGYKYQVSRFPFQLTTNHLKILQQDEVDACDHPEKYHEVDLGIIDTMEGRECRKCHGYQSKQKGESWPAKWQANGSRSVLTMNSGYNEDLAVGLVKKGLSLSEAIIVAAGACERCMNVLADEVGLDWGYARGSEDYNEARTSCGLCTNGDF
jgi:hypothetical protein